MFFILCGVMGYYGLGLMVFIAAVLLMYATMILRSLKAIIMLIVAGITMFWFINQFIARTLDYIITNLERTTLVLESYSYDQELKKAREMEVTQIPRFVVFLDGARKRIFESPKVFLLGTSPGGYNSRTAFYLNGDFVQNRFLLENFNNRTVYHKEDIFPLLNRELISKPYNDGTRNQTFSSIISVIMEYGLLLGLLYWIIFSSKLWWIIRREKDVVRNQFIRFLSVYLLLILMVQNYLEYPEIVFPFILLIKLAEVDRVNKAVTKLDHNEH